MSENKPFSLSARLKKAEHTSDILQLLAEGAKYAYASDKTRRRWKRLATEQRKALEVPQLQASQPPTKSVTGKTKSVTGKTKYAYKKKA